MLSDRRGQFRPLPRVFSGRAGARLSCCPERLAPGAARAQAARRHCCMSLAHNAARIMSAAFSAIMMVAALVLPLTMVGMIEASATRNPPMPRTRSW